MLKPYLAILTTIVLFSTIEVVTKHIAPNVDIFFLAFVRFFAAGVLILALGARRIRSVTRKDFTAMLVLAVVGVPLAFGAFHLSLRTTPASTGAVIFSLNPIFSSLAAVYLVGERLKPRSLAGLALGFAGVYVVSFGLSPVSEAALTGPLLMLLSAAAFGVYIAAAKRYVGRYGPFLVTGFMFATGSLLLLPLVRGTVHAEILPTAAWIAYLTVAATGLAYLLYFYGLQHVPVVAGTSVFYLKPIIASALATAFLGERLAVHFYGGLAVVLVSLALTVSQRAKPAQT